MILYQPIIPAIPKLIKLPSNGVIKNLYMLDWKQKEKQVEINIENYIKFYLKHVNKNIPDYAKECLFFPKEYLEWLNSLRFNIPIRHFIEIKYHFKCALNVWKQIYKKYKKYEKEDEKKRKLNIYLSSGKNGFMWDDTCNKPAIAHCEAAFKLLDECVCYDLKQNKYYESDYFSFDKIFNDKRPDGLPKNEIPHFSGNLMSIYFLDGQIGAYSSIIINRYIKTIKSYVDDYYGIYENEYLIIWVKNIVRLIQNNINTYFNHMNEHYNCKDRYPIIE